MKNPNRNRKRHYSERFRGPNLLVERWTNSKSALVGYYVAKGLGSPDVSARLADGTSPATLRGIVKKWRLPGGFSNRGCRFPLLSSHKRRLLVDQAAEIGIESEEMLRRICECAIGDSLYAAIVGDRYK